MSSKQGQRGKKLLLVVLMSQVLTCTSVSKEEKSETLERILRVEEEPKAVASLEPSNEEEEVAKTETQSSGESSESTAKPLPQSEPVPSPKPTPVVDVSLQPTPTALPTVLAEPSPTARPASPSGIAQRPAPNLKQPQKLDLPLPRGVVHADLFHFLNAHADMIVPYHPMAEEWNLYAKAFSAGSRGSEDEIAGLRARVRENLARAHWLFVWGVFQASNNLLSPQKNMQLIVDRQTDFIERMNVLVFLMVEMNAAGMKTNHRNFLKDFYKYINLKHFKRPMRDRPAKPIGTLRP